jgi:acyl-CoA reductase-like NAD-dependent aldehyde dehydrogenase
VAGSRVLVQRKIYDEFLELYAKKASAIRVGQPLSPQTQMGAQTSDEQLSRIENYVEDAKSSGATIITGVTTLASRAKKSSDRLPRSFRSRTKRKPSPLPTTRSTGFLRGCGRTT